VLFYLQLAADGGQQTDCGTDDGWWAFFLGSDHRGATTCQVGSCIMHAFWSAVQEIVGDMTEDGARHCYKTACRSAP